MVASDNFDKRIGKPVLGDELQRVLDREAEKDRIEEQLQEELKAIKPGECLVYETGPEVPLWASIGFALIVDKVPGLKVIKEGACTYVYRVKK
jgi:hypothetical protein